MKLISDHQVEKDRGELAFSLGNIETSNTKVENAKNDDPTIMPILVTFRSRFSTQASNRKANRLANRRSLAATAVKEGVRLFVGGGGAMVTFSRRRVT